MKKSRVYLASEIMVMMIMGSVLTFCSGGRLATAGVSDNQAFEEGEESGENEFGEKDADEGSGEKDLGERDFDEGDKDEGDSDERDSGDKDSGDKDSGDKDSDEKWSDEKESGKEDQDEKESEGELYIDTLKADAHETVNGFALSLRVSVSACCIRGKIVGYGMKGPFSGENEASDFDEEDYKEDNVFEITQNGEYYFSVKDSENRRACVVTDVDMIDRSAPVIASVKSQAVEGRNGYGHGSVINVYAYDMESGLHPEAFSFDDGESYSDSYSFVTDKNGIYHIRVRDGLGNVSRQAFELNDIDDEAPVMTITGIPERKTADDVTLSIECVDEKSGMSAVWYGDGDEEAGKKYLGRYNGDKKVRVLMKIEENDTYMIYGADEFGNTVCQSVTVEVIDRSLSSSAKKKSSSSSARERYYSSSVRKQISSSMSTMVIGADTQSSNSDSITKKELILKSTSSSSFVRKAKEQENVGKSVTIKSEYDDEFEEDEETEDDLWDFNSDEYTVSLNSSVSSGDKFEVEKLVENYPKAYSANTELPDKDIMPDKEEKAVAPQKIVAVGVAVTMLLAALIIFILSKLGIIDTGRIVAAVRAARESGEDDE
ncbi:MAG: hypothetical protein IJM23_00910 [Lachnospiraceae bacterium]|nr:hypothetical protein [Lachnospiraceae bacterium]